MSQMPWNFARLLKFAVSSGNEFIYYEDTIIIRIGNNLKKNGAE